MALRPQPTGRRYRRPLRRVYEDFEPTVEQLEQDGVTLLQVHLPGFKREQINTACDESVRITYPRLRETPAHITIKGERPLGNNKWGRFNKTLGIPGDCDIAGIQTKLEGGIYTITIPKKKVTSGASQPGEAVKPSQGPSSQETMAEPKPPERAGTPQESSTSVSDDKIHKEEKIMTLRSLQRNVKGTKVPEGQEDTLHKPSSTLTDDSEKKIDKRKVVSSEKVDEEKMFGKKQRSEGIKDSKEPMHPDEYITGTSASAQAKQTGKSSQDSIVDDVNSAIRNLEDELEAMLAATRKHASKPLAISLKEQRKLFVNMGVALTVIMALGVHIGITFWS